MILPNSFPQNDLRKRAISAFLLLLVSSFLLAGCKEKEEVAAPEPVRPVKLHTVTQGLQDLQMSLPGKIRAAQRSELSFKVSGPLQELPIEEGQVVEKGELIAQILKRDFETAITEAKARELEAEQQYNRYKELYAKRQVSKADFDRYRASRDVARAQLEDAQNALQDTTLLAPFDGVIARRYVENFQKVQAKEPIVFLQHIDKLEVLIDVPELMMAQFSQSDEISVTAEFDSAPGTTYPLSVKEFSTDADPATQTYQVVLAMDQPEEINILPGMTAKVNAVAGEQTPTSQGSVSIPAISVLNDADGNDYVWVFSADDKTVSKAKVSIGPLEGTKNVVVTEGLNDGDIIVMAGVSKLQEGMQVRPWENQREGK